MVPRDLEDLRDQEVQHFAGRNGLLNLMNKFGKIQCRHFTHAFGLLQPWHGRLHLWTSCCFLVSGSCQTWKRLPDVFKLRSKTRACVTDDCTPLMCFFVLLSFLVLSVSVFAVGFFFYYYFIISFKNNKCSRQFNQQYGAEICSI